MASNSFQLVRDCEATLIPAGDVVVLEKATPVTVTQALGGSVTLQTPLGLFRLAAKDLDALGENAQESLGLESEAPFTPSGPFGEATVWEALKGCFDPEIPINIVDLGLIYDLSIEPAGNDLSRVNVKMTLTAQGCGMGPAIAADAKAKIEAIPEVAEADVAIVWDPPWNPQMISEEGRRRMGLA